MKFINQDTWVIVGAGAAGLWLALELVDSGALEGKKLVILEQDDNKGNDKTWCFWESKSLSHSILNDAVSHRWNRVSYSARDHNGIKLQSLAYFHIRSADFYRVAKEKLQKKEHVSFLYESVTEYLSLKDGVTVVTDCNRRVKAKMVFTSVFEPFFKKPDIDFWQSFVGRRVKFNKDVFDEDCFTLMDFNIPQNGATQFIYVLPFSKNEALIEVTAFGKEIIDERFAVEEINKFSGNFSAGFEFIEKEAGRIPMSQRLAAEYNKHHDARIVPIGTVSGAIKPTTGYGFMEMKRRAEIIARKLQKGEDAPVFKRSARFRFYDLLLLNILKNEPARGVEIFTSLFKATSPGHVFKFLDEKTTVLGDIKIFKSLPVPLFLKHLYKMI